MYNCPSSPFFMAAHSRLAHSGYTSYILCDYDFNEITIMFFLGSVLLSVLDRDSEINM
jgi:hypothetical protein